MAASHSSSGSIHNLQVQPAQIARAQAPHRLLISQAPPDQDRHTPGQLEPLLQFMGSQEHRTAAQRQLLQHPCEAGSGLRIEAGIGLIQQQNGRLVQYGPGNAQALHLPPRKSTHQVRRPLFQPHPLQGCPRLLLWPAQAIEPRMERQVLRHGQVAVKKTLVRNDPDQPADLGAPVSEVEPADQYFAGRRAGQCRQDADQGRLARPIWSQEGDKVALIQP